MPNPFLESRVDDVTCGPSLLVVCAGYESGQWRCEQLARHVIDWLPEFVLPPEEHENVNVGNCMEHIRRAARTVYTTEKYQKRGEFGELLLYAILRQFYGTIPAIAKLYFKTATNDTVKGFDAVHVVANGTDLELWLGEVKLYTSVSKAIHDVVEELHAHFKSNYLRDEFLLITNKLDDSMPHAAVLRSLLDENTSLDQVFTQIRVPVLLTYDSKSLANHTSVCDAFRTALEAEARKAHAAFAAAGPPPDITIHLILLPLNTKGSLVTAVDTKLKLIQAL